MDIAAQLAQLTADVAALRHHLHAENNRDALDILDHVNQPHSCTKCLVMDNYLDSLPHPDADISPDTRQDPHELAS